MSTTAMSKAESSALSVSYEVLGSRVELDLQFVKNYLVRGKGELVSDQEVVFFMNTCKMQGLNPLVNGEVYLIKYSKDTPAQMVVGKDAYLRRAYSNPDYLYKNDGIVVLRGQEVVQKEGCCLYPGEQLLGGWCRIFFLRNSQERSAFKEVSFSEYNQGQANWKVKPATMINKVAVSQCIRDAFPKDYEGVYSEEEMVASGAVPADYVTVGDTGSNAEPENEDQDSVITQEQRQALFKTAQETFGKAEGNAIVKSLIKDIGLTSTSEMRQSVYGKVIEKLMELCVEQRKIQQEQPDEIPAFS